MLIIKFWLGLDATQYDCKLSDNDKKIFLEKISKPGFNIGHFDNIITKRPFLRFFFKNGYHRKNQLPGNLEINKIK